jgi:hypothetical protein
MRRPLMAALVAVPLALLAVAPATADRATEISGS